MSTFTYTVTSLPVAPWQETVDLFQPLGMTGIRGFGWVQAYGCADGSYLLLRLQSAAVVDIVHSASADITDTASWIVSTLAPGGTSNGGPWLPLVDLTDYLGQPGATSAGAAALLMQANDHLIGSAGDETILGGGGLDTLDYGAATGPVQADLATGLATGQGTDHLSGIECLVGSAFGDSLAGDDAANLLAGGAGDDTLSGGRGADTLQGGAGADLLRGGAGADVFLFATAAEAGDTILGYRGAQDRIEVSAAGFGFGLVAGMDLAATGHYVANHAGMARGAEAQFVFDTTTKSLWWDHDGRGGDAPVLIADLPDAVGWSGAEIVVIA